MIVSINQPAYLPWLGYFDRISQSDLHIVLDHVQLEKGSFVNRNRIMLPDGRLHWLTVPVEKGKPICETKIIGQKWRRKHEETLYQAYGIEWGTPESDSLLEVCLASCAWLANNDYLLSSQLSSRSQKSELVLDLCREVGADVYLSGPLGRDYLDLPAFEEADIEVRWHEYIDPDPVPLSAVHHLFKEKSWPQSHPTLPPFSQVLEPPHRQPARPPAPWEAPRISRSRSSSR